MSAFSARLQAMATRLIKKHGRDMQLVQKRNVRQKDPNMPWRGYARTTGDPPTIKCVILPHETRVGGQAEISGDNIGRDNEIAFVSGASTSIEIKPNDKIVDGGVTHTVVRPKHYKVVNTSVLYVLEVRR